MTDIYAPTPADPLSAEELALYRAIMAYRSSLGLPEIPLSQGLTVTAGRHALDWVDNIWAAGLALPEGANLHSWSDAPYWGDHRAPENMWQAPVRLGTSYTDTGYEISAAGFADGDAALVGWQGSPGHNNIIINTNGWEALDFSAIGVGIEHGDPAAGPYGGHIYHVWFGDDPDPAGGPDFEGGDAADTYTNPGGDARLMGRGGDDVITGGAGRDTINGGDGDDVLTGGTGAGDLSDLILGMEGADTIDGGAGNDDIFGGAGGDVLAGGAGADTLAGQQGDDVITGGAWSDLISGGEGFDFINGGWGHDRLSGGGDADRFFHAGHAGHGADWIQDYAAAEADVLLWGGTPEAGAGDFLVQYATTAGAGADDVAEAFVTHVPSGQLLWALVDGADQETLWLRLAGGDVDLLG